MSDYNDLYRSEEVRAFENEQLARSAAGEPVRDWDEENARNRAALIAYLTIFGAAYALLLSGKQKYHLVRFNAVQSILMSIVEALSGGLYFPLKLTVWFLLLGFWVICLYRAGNGKYFRVPLIGWLTEAIVGRIPNQVGT